METKRTYQRHAPRLQERRFIRLYQVTGNSTQSALDAGYKCKTRAVAGTQGHRLLKRAQVRRAMTDWRSKLEDAVLPSLETIEQLRDNAEDDRVRLAAARDLLNRAGIGKVVEQKQNVVAVFANMNEDQLLERMAKIAARNTANPSQDNDDVSHNIDCATQNSDGVPGSDSPAAQ